MVIGGVISLTTISNSWITVLHGFTAVTITWVVPLLNRLPDPVPLPVLVVAPLNT